MRVNALLVIGSSILVALAGCVGPAALTSGGAADLATLVPRIAANGTTVEGLAPLVWQGSRLASDGIAGPPGIYHTPPCGEGNCERIPFTIDLPEGYWAANPGAVEVSIEWEHQEEDYGSFETSALPMGHYLGLPSAFMHLRVLDADGNLVQDGVDAFHFQSLALIDSLPPGDYLAEVHALWGEASYRGVVQIEPAVEPTPGEQLPDMIILTPSELTLEHPIGREIPDPLVPLGRKGCDPDEAFEYGAVRCLRFATGFGNAGPGRLELHLSSAEADRSLLGEGQWMQYVYDDKGNYREVPASPSSYHKVHGHYHILGLDVSTVYHYDLATSTRGEPVGDGHKTGFCPVDSALIDPLGLGTTYPTNYPGCCYLWGLCQMDYVDHGEYRIGLSAGWYDVYPWWRADQYVDIDGAPDGVYELETCANPDRYMVELNYDNNCASVLFELKGNDVTVIGPPTQS